VTAANSSSHERRRDTVIDRQHVWVGPEATSFEVSCEACQARRGGWSETYRWALSVDSTVIEGTIRGDADVGFTTCRRGHRIVVHRVGRAVARLH
jgi:hypothetical protein